MDIATYVLVKKKLDNVTLAFDYKGSVESVSDLPEDATKGDLYTVVNAQYVYDGSNWMNISDNSITNAQIDALFA